MKKIYKNYMKNKMIKKSKINSPYNKKIVLIFIIDYNFTFSLVSIKF